MTAPHVRSEVENNILFVTLARPEKRNALTPRMLCDVSAAVVAADRHPQVRAVVVLADGPTFSAGIDLMSLAASKAEACELNAGRWLRRLASELQRSLDAIEETEVPVIGALQGQVIGLGLELALAFDLRIGADDLKLSIPEARVGLVADVGGTTRLSRLVGPGRAKDMLLTARAVDAPEALSWGLLNRVVPANELRARAVALAEEIMANAPLAVGSAKLIVDQGDGVDRHTQLALERWAQSQLIATEDVGEAMAAFFEKRKANFKGR